MRYLRSMLLMLSLAVSLQAQGPRMTLAGTTEAIPIDSVAVRIELGGGVARTEMELTFRNETERPQEGEFVWPLPPGATVSSYALEVNGAMRDSVAVEKERARNAYEQIKRRMIDPGLVEREAGNVYRTRVFPVPAGGTKRMRIGYVETLPLEGGKFRYKLPLSFGGEVRSFSCEINGAAGIEPELRGALPLSFVSSGNRGEQSSGAENVDLNGELELRLPQTNRPELRVGDGTLPTFLLSDVAPEGAPLERPAPRKVLLFWDASESGLDHDPADAFALLDRLFGHFGSTSVELRLLRDRMEPAGVHQVKNGDWGGLRRRLEAVDYEGASALDGLDTAGADLAIYCGDGSSNIRSMVGRVDCPLLFLQLGSEGVSNSLLRAAMESGGARVKVDGGNVEENFQSLVIRPFRVVDVRGAGVLEFQQDSKPLTPGGAVRIVGRLSGSDHGPIEVVYDTGGREVVRRVDDQVSGSTGRLVERLWHQGKLAALEAEGDRAAILAYCEKHTLVSDVTSLIVLERFEDHITYRIPPPEPDLLARYRKQLNGQKRLERSRFEIEWDDRLEWHHRNFPGREVALLPRLRQVDIWKRAVEKVFKPEELDEEAFGVIAAWHGRVLGVIEKRKALPDAGAYEAWLEEVAKLDADGRKLGETRIKSPEGEAVVVSVRGLVAEPGQVRSKESLTLLESIKQVGGSLSGEETRRVALYRNAGKTVYDPSSDGFEDFKLLPGDMVVVEFDWDDYGSVDPFSGTSSVDRGPIVAQHDVWIEEDAKLPDPLGTDVRRGKPGRVVLIDAAEGDLPDLAAFKNGMDAGEEPLALLREVKKGVRRPLRFHIEAARILFEAGHERLAERVLSTLIERGRGSDASRRAYAFWLMEFGEAAKADEVLRSLASTPGACPSEFARVELAENDAEVAELLGTVIAKQASTSMTSIALTELNRLNPRAHPRGGRFRKNLPADLRITVLSQLADAEVDLQVIDPTGKATGRWRRTSPCGGRHTGSDGVAEFMVRRALPGTYLIRASSEIDTTLRIAIHSDWGRDEMKTRRLTRFTEAKGREDLATVEFEFVPSEEAE